MNQLTRFDTAALNRALVGFDQMFDTFDARFANQLSTNYPPYNVIKRDEDHYSIEVAIAGFLKEEVTVEVANDQLVIKGERATEIEDGKTYLHRGLSSRNFVRSFALAEHIFVQGAATQNGILRVDLERVVPEEKKPRMIDIEEIK